MNTIPPLLVIGFVGGSLAAVITICYLLVRLDRAGLVVDEQNNLIDHLCSELDEADADNAHLVEAEGQVAELLQRNRALEAQLLAALSKHPSTRLAVIDGGA